jgi:hypothetical protein
MVSGGRPDKSNINRDEIVPLVEQALGRKALEDFYTNYKLENQSYINGEWVIPVSIPLTKTDIQNRYEGIIPRPALSFPKDKGYTHCETNKGRPIDYMPIGNANRFRGSSFSSFNNNYTYSIQSNKLIVDGDCDIDDVNLKTVTLYIAAPNNFNTNEAAALSVIASVIEILKPRISIPADMTNDNNPNTK